MLHGHLIALDPDPYFTFSESAAEMVDHLIVRHRVGFARRSKRSGRWASAPPPTNANLPPTNANLPPTTTPLCRSALAAASRRDVDAELLPLLSVAAVLVPLFLLVQSNLKELLASILGALRDRDRSAVRRRS